MRVISKARLREFWESRKDDAEIAERAMSAWHKAAEDASWANWGELKQTFGTADRVGNCVVFDVGNNKYRVIGRVNFDKGKLYILKAMDHKEYDKKDNKGKQRWIEQCGCNKPPSARDQAKPKQAPPEKTASKTTTRRKPKRRN